jgi:hypothetical protein
MTPTVTPRSVLLEYLAALKAIPHPLLFKATLMDLTLPGLLFAHMFSWTAAGNRFCLFQSGSYMLGVGSF